MEYATKKQQEFLSELLAAKGIEWGEFETAIGMEVKSINIQDMSNLLALVQKSKDKDEAINKAREKAIYHQDVPAEIKAPPRHPFTTDKVDWRVELMASIHGIPKEIANMFFMIIDETLYIKTPGLLYMAAKKGYSKITVTSEYDKDKDEWNATAMVYPKIPIQVITQLHGLPDEVQNAIMDTQYGPTVGHGRACKDNVRNTKMYPFLRELAETRAMNRAIRPFTGYGGTSFEELPEAQIEEADDNGSE